MDTIIGHSNRPIVGSHRIPDDIIIYILDFLESNTLATMTRASRHLQEVVTPTLYRKITIPKKEGEDTEHQKSAAHLLRTLSRKSSLAALVQHLENAPTLVPPEVLKSVCSEHTYPSNLQTESAEQSSLVHPSHPVPEDAMRSCVNLQSLTVAGTIDIGNINGTGGWLSFLLDPSIKLKNLGLLVYPQGLLTSAIWNSFVAKVLDIQLSLEYLDSPEFSIEYPFSIIKPSPQEQRTKKWLPELRALGGNRASGLKILLASQRPIEMVMVYSLPMTDIPRSFSNELKRLETIKEFIYGGATKGLCRLFEPA